jgi:hypothetical protein
LCRVADRNTTPSYGLYDRFHETSGHGTRDFLGGFLVGDWLNEELYHGEMAASV